MSTVTLEEKLKIARKALLKAGMKIEDIEDALQDTCVKILERDEDLDNKPASFFTVSAYRRCIDLFRHYGRTPLIDNIEKLSYDDQELIDELLDQNEDIDILLS